VGSASVCFVQNVPITRKRLSARGLDSRRIGRRRAKPPESSPLVYTRTAADTIFVRAQQCVSSLDHWDGDDCRRLIRWSAIQRLVNSGRPPTETRVRVRKTFDFDVRWRRPVDRWSSARG